MIKVHYLKTTPLLIQSSRLSKIMEDNNRIVVYKYFGKMKFVGLQEAVNIKLPFRTILKLEGQGRVFEFQEVKHDKKGFSFVLSLVQEEDCKRVSYPKVCPQHS